MSNFFRLAASIATITVLASYLPLFLYIVYPAIYRNGNRGTKRIHDLSKAHSG